MNPALIPAAAFLLDIVLADPKWLPHPVVGIGHAISKLESGLRRNFPPTPRGEYIAGLVLTALVCFLAFGATIIVLGIAIAIHPALYWLITIILACQTLAARGLYDAATKVYSALAKNDMGVARHNVRQIVGRDADRLDRQGIIRATVETVAENASDGVVAPLFYLALGGVPLAILYKAINTLDSMVGYKNDKYIFLGRAAARLDDLANFIPARLTAALLLCSAWLWRYNWRNGIAIYKRDKRNHTSPNAGHPEAAVAGALGIRLGGSSYYFGVLVSKPYIGDNLREPDDEDIRKANILMYTTAVLMTVLSCAFIYSRVYW